jgi:hypothetical protein
VNLEPLAHCFEGGVPAILSTATRGGHPNLIAVSHVHRVDATHVGISRQFFKKTRANLDENPVARLGVMDSQTLETYRLTLRFEREETTGPVFDAMATRLDAIASMTGMRGVFRLQAAMIFEVCSVEHLPALLERDETTPPAAAVDATAIDGMTQLRVLRSVSDTLRAIGDAESLLTATLQLLDEGLGFTHAMVLLLDETHRRLYAVASRGYAESGVGAEVRLGEGIIGTVAERRRLLRVSNLGRAVRYGRAVRSSVERPASDEVPLPGLENAESALALPLLVKDELLGVLAVESTRPLAYGERDEAFLEVVAGQIALGLAALLHDETEPGPPSSTATPKAEPTRGPTRRFAFYAADDCVFVDDQYLIRNVPGRILWKLLRAYRDEGRTEFTNRELRLDDTLGLPQLRDNLESRLILLRKRLCEKCPEVAMVPNGRGRFVLQVRCELELSEKR